MSLEENKNNKMNRAIILAFQKGYTPLKNGNIIGTSGKPLSLNKKDTRGYLVFGVRNYKKRETIKIGFHRFIAYCKYGDKLFEDNIEVRHLDGNKENNNWDNIEIGTHSQNMFDKDEEVRLTQAIKASNNIRKFSDEQMEDIYKDRETGMTYKEIMKKYNISSKGTLSYMINTKYKTKK